MINRIVFKLIVFLLLTAANTYSFAQDLAKDLKQMGERYQNVASFGTDMTIEVQYSENTPLQVHQKAKIRKKENKFYCRMGQAETIVSGQLLIMVNDGSKSIFFRQLEEKEQEAIARKYYQSGIDSITSKYDSAVYTGTNQYGKHYVIYSEKNMISKTDLFIDETTGFLNRVVYGYNKKLSKDIYKIVISFSYPALTTLDEKLLKEETYLLKTGTQYKPAQKYLNYELNKVDNE